MNTVQECSFVDRPAQMARVLPLPAASFAGRRFPQERLAAFASRFRPPAQTWPDRLVGLGATAGLYLAAYATVYGISHIDVLQVLRAFGVPGA